MGEVHHFCHCVFFVVERGADVRDACGIGGGQRGQGIHIAQIQHDVDLIPLQQFVVINPVLWKPQASSHKLVVEPTLFEKAVFEDSNLLIEQYNSPKVAAASSQPSQEG